MPANKKTIAGMARSYKTSKPAPANALSCHLTVRLSR